MARFRKDTDEVLASLERITRGNRSGALRGPDGRFISNELGEVASSDDELPARNGHVSSTEIGMDERPFFRGLEEFEPEEIVDLLTSPNVPNDEKAWFLTAHDEDL